LWNVSLANKRCFAVSDGGPTTGRGIGYHGGSLSPATGGVRPTQRDCQPPSHQSQYRKGLGKGTETGGGVFIQPTIEQLADESLSNNLTADSRRLTQIIVLMPFGHVSASWPKNYLRRSADNLPHSCCYLRSSILNPRPLSFPTQSSALVTQY